MSIVERLGDSVEVVPTRMGVAETVLEITAMTTSVCSVVTTARFEVDELVKAVKSWFADGDVGTSLTLEGNGVKVTVTSDEPVDSETVDGLVRILQQVLRRR